LAAPPVKDQALSFAGGPDLWVKVLPELETNPHSLHRFGYKTPEDSSHDVCPCWPLVCPKCKGELNIARANHHSFALRKLRYPIATTFHHAHR
jgi:hypothetical protein